MEGGARPRARLWSGGSRRPQSRPWARSAPRVSVPAEPGALSGQGTELGWLKVRQEGPRRPGCGVRRWRAAAFPARSVEKAGRPRWLRPQDAGVSRRPPRSLGLRKHQPSLCGGRKSKVKGQQCWFLPAVLGLQTPLPHVTPWVVCPLKRTPVAGSGPTRVQEDLLTVLSFSTPAQVQLHHQIIR